MNYTIENKYIKLVVSSMGATIRSFIEKDTNTDIVLGFDSDDEYIKNKWTFAGATIARNCNRIANAEFEINGVTYHMDKNNGVNNLHSGDGTYFEEFTLKESNDTSLVFELNLKDGKDGFPGNMKLTVIYELIDNKMRITYKALSDKDTIFNVTNHSYFNLDGGSTNILNHEAKVYTDKVAINDENGMSKEDTKNVEDTIFDFREFNTFKHNFEVGDNNSCDGGIDHNFVYESLETKELITLRNDKLVLTMCSDYPCMHMYTACGFKDIKGKYGNVYQKYHAVALEPQFYPNAINYNKYLKPIIKANQEVTHFIDYIIEKRG